MTMRPGNRLYSVAPLFRETILVKSFLNGGLPLLLSAAASLPPGDTFALEDKVNVLCYQFDNLVSFQCRAVSASGHGHGNL